MIDVFYNIYKGKLIEVIYYTYPTGDEWWAEVVIIRGPFKG